MDDFIGKELFVLFGINFVFSFLIIHLLNSSEPDIKTKHCRAPLTGGKSATLKLRALINEQRFLIFV